MRVAIPAAVAVIAALMLLVIMIREDVRKNREDKERRRNK